jgi:hypothetical protein
LNGIDPVPPRIVKPRRETDSAAKPLIVLDDKGILIERTGEVHPTDALPELTVSEPSSIVVCQRSTLWLAKLDKIFDSNPRWQWRVSPIERDHYVADRKKTSTVRDTVVAFWGFRRTNGHAKSLYHYPLDPLAFIGKAACEIVPECKDSIDALRQWGEDIRAFLTENRIGIKPTSGGIASQFLRDKRFFPDDRRKVPRATNETARKHLPGNHYRLHTKEREFNHALYFDQIRAHHSCAHDLNFPHPDSLYVRGNFHDPDDARIWAKEGSPLYEAHHPSSTDYSSSAFTSPHSYLQTEHFAPPFMD